MSRPAAAPAALVSTIAWRPVATPPPLPAPPGQQRRYLVCRAGAPAQCADFTSRGLWLAGSGLQAVQPDFWAELPLGPAPPPTPDPGKV